MNLTNGIMLIIPIIIAFFILPPALETLTNSTLTNSTLPESIQTVTTIATTIIPIIVLLEIIMTIFSRMIKSPLEEYEEYEEEDDIPENETTWEEYEIQICRYCGTEQPLDNSRCCYCNAPTTRRGKVKKYRPKSEVTKP